MQKYCLVYEIIMLSFLEFDLNDQFMVLMHIPILNQVQVIHTYCFTFEVNNLFISQP